VLVSVLFLHLRINLSDGQRGAVGERCEGLQQKGGSDHRRSTTPARSGASTVRLYWKAITIIRSFISFRRNYIFVLKQALSLSLCDARRTRATTRPASVWTYAVFICRSVENSPCKTAAPAHARMAPSLWSWIQTDPRCLRRTSFSACTSDVLLLALTPLKMVGQWVANEPPTDRCLPSVKQSGYTAG
jgi:hypothetical protein